MTQPDKGAPLPTKWITHPITNVTTVTITTDRAYLLIEPHDPDAILPGDTTQPRITPNLTKFAKG